MTETTTTAPAWSAARRLRRAVRTPPAAPTPPARRVERRRAPRPPVPWPWVALGAAVVAAWTAVAAAGGGDVVVAGITLTISGGGAAAAGGAALLAGTTSLRQGWSLAATLVGALLLPIALAAAASAGDARPLLGLLPLVVALGVAGGGRTRTARLRSVAIAGVGTTLLAAAVLAGSATYSLGASTTTFATTIVIAGVLLVIAGAGGSVGVPALKPLLAVGALAGIVGASAVPGIGVPLLVGAAAVGIAGVRPAVAVALFAFAVAALPGGQPAASLLAAGAVLAVAVERDWAVVAALPGAIAMVEVLMFPGEIAPRVVVGAVATVLGIQVARDIFPTRDLGRAGDEGSRLAAPVDLAALPGVGPRRAERHRIPAIVLIAWLLVAPGSWTWAGDAGIHHYDTGAGRAVAVAGLVLAGLAGADHRAALRRSRMAA